MKHTKGLKSARMKDAFCILPKTLPKILCPPLPAIENVEEPHKDVSDDSEGQGVRIIRLSSSSHEKHISQPPQTNNKPFKIAITFFNG